MSTYPRRFATVSRSFDPRTGAHILDAVDTDGVAWTRVIPRENNPIDWYPLTPLPGRHDPQ
jgi:hypothetical protein